MSRLNKRQVNIRDKYTSVQMFCGLWCAKLSVGNQSFRINIGSRRQAEWYQRMLAIALDRMIEAEKEMI